MRPTFLVSLAMTWIAPPPMAARPTRLAVMLVQVELAKISRRTDYFCVAHSSWLEPLFFVIPSPETSVWGPLPSA